MKLPRTVIALGLVSFFTDISSEMIYPLLPVFLATTLGGTALGIGLIEGVAEATAALFKVFSGAAADRVQTRKGLVVGGYGLSSIARPMIGLASATSHVLGLRFLDRIGKGIRTSPRDALIADATPKELRGRAYGLHRAMDNAGSVLGPLVAAALMRGLGFSIPDVFLYAAVPAAIAMAVLIVLVPKDEPNRPPAAKAGKEPFAPRRDWQQLGAPFKKMLLALMLFTLGNSTDAFLLLKLSSEGVTSEGVVLLWAALSVVKMVASWYGGIHSDKVGHRKMILRGWVYYAAIYLGFAFVSGIAPTIVLFLAYGLFFGFVEPSERALVASYAPEGLRGTTFGWFHGTIGLGALPASLLFGGIHSAWGATAAFGTGAALAFAASCILMTMPDDAPSPSKN